MDRSTHAVVTQKNEELRCFQNKRHNATRGSQRGFRGTRVWFKLKQLRRKMSGSASQPEAILPSPFTHAPGTSIETKCLGTSLPATAGEADSYYPLLGGQQEGRSAPCRAQDTPHQSRHPPRQEEKSTDADEA